MALKTVCVLMGALTSVVPLAAGAASAPDFPTRPIRLILPVGPGGGQDTTARAMNQKLTEALGQSVIIDPRPGGGGNIAALLASRATPDGHTLLNISTTAVTTPLVYEAPYDLQRDFTAVSQLVSNPYLLVATPTLPAKSVGELIAYAKANPDKLAFASAGSGSLTHLGLEILKIQTGITMTHVPYKGMGPTAPDLMSGRVHLGLWSIVSAQPHVRAGRLKALAVSSTQRARAAPEVPTIAESGVPGFAVTQWYGVIAPARTPRPIVDRLGRAMSASIKDPEVAARVAHDGAEPVGSSPPEFTAHLKAEHAKWARIVQQTGIRNQVQEAR
jgi:tripartite-type tricarboxylate transporter receptor subunit TctC